METVYTLSLETPVGPLSLASSREGLLYVGLPHASGAGMQGFLHRRAPDAKREEGYAPNRVAAKQILEFLEGKRDAFELPLDLRGTPFQRDVWDALLAIPYGETCSYADLAKRVGRPGAVRAVGSANGANPLALVVPCHRVIASDGKLGGYAGGLELKAKLLAMEQASKPGQVRLF